MGNAGLGPSSWAVSWAIFGVVDLHCSLDVKSASSIFHWRMFGNDDMDLFFTRTGKKSYQKWHVFIYVLTHIFPLNMTCSGLRLQARSARTWVCNCSPVFCRIIIKWMLVVKDTTIRIIKYFFFYWLRRLMPCDTCGVVLPKIFETLDVLFTIIEKT